MATLSFSLEGLRVKAIDANGAVMPGALLYTYAAGGLITPLATYSDVALTTQHANPVVADAGGLFPQIFLSNTAAYAFDLQTSGGVSYETLDNVYSPAYLAFNAVQGAIAGTVEGRLTLTSGTPVTTSDVTAAVNVYFTPYKGTSIGLFDGTLWQSIAFTEQTLSIAGFAASTPFDVWGRISAGVLAIDSTAWTNDTTRATALTTQNGVYVKSGDTTRRYLGTFRTTGTVGQTEDSLAKRFCWNYYNRVPRAMKRVESTASWAYTTATFRQANASTANQLAFVIGVNEVPVQAALIAAMSNTAAGVAICAAIGLDSTSSPSGIYALGSTSAANYNMNIGAHYSAFPGLGYHYLAWLEYSGATGTSTWVGANGTTTQSGLVGEIEG